MPKLHVHTPFTLRHDDGTTENYGVGEYEFPAPVAAHWYVEHHTRAPGAEKAKAGAKQEDSVDNSAAEQEAALKAAAEFLNGEKAALDARSDELAKREAALNDREAALAAREQEHAARVAAFAAEKSDVAQEEKVAQDRQGAQGNQQKHQGGKR